MTDRAARPGAARREPSGDMSTLVAGDGVTLGILKLSCATPAARRRPPLGQELTAFDGRLEACSWRYASILAGLEFSVAAGCPSR